MAGIELVGLGEAEVTAEQIGERAFAERLAMQGPLAAGRNQPVGDEHEQDLFPTRALAAGRQARGEEAVESQLLRQLQAASGDRLTRSAKLEAREAQADDGSIGRRRLAAYSGNSAIVCGSGGPVSSKTSIDLRQASSCEELISPR